MLDAARTTPSAGKEVSGVRADFDSVAELRQRGLRATTARVAVLVALNERGHSTADQLHAVLTSEWPSVSLSTVYRTVESLSARDLIRHAHLGGSAPSYYLASEAEHAHLVCSLCGSIEDLTGPPLQRFVTDLADGARFNIDTSHLTVEGRCESCRQRTPKPAGTGVPVPAG